MKCSGNDGVGNYLTPLYIYIYICCFPILLRSFQCTKMNRMKLYTDNADKHDHDNNNDTTSCIFFLTYPTIVAVTTTPNLFIYQLSCTAGVSAAASSQCSHQWEIVQRECWDVTDVPGVPETPSLGTARPHFLPAKRS